MSNLKRNSLSMELCIRISKFLYDKKTNKLRIKDFWEELKENQDFGDYKVDGKKEWIESLIMVKLQRKRLLLKLKIITRQYSNTAALVMSGRSISMQLLAEHRPIYTIKPRLKQQLLLIPVKGVKGVKGFSRLRQIISSKPTPKKMPMRTFQRVL